MISPPVIYFDVHGVLSMGGKVTPDDISGIDVKKVAILIDLAETSGAKLVLLSTGVRQWRDEEGVAFLKRIGLAPYLMMPGWKAPLISRDRAESAERTKPAEVSLHAEQYDVSYYVAIDDKPFEARDYKGKFIQVGSFGLTQTTARECLHVLERGKSLVPKLPVGEFAARIQGAASESSLAL